MAYKTLQNPDLYGKGNDYEQTLDYVVQKDENGKTTWRDGIYTKLAYDIKDPEGYNKRTVNVPQSAWNAEFDTIPSGKANTLSGETDGSGLFSDDYATAKSFGQPFNKTLDVAPEYYNPLDVVKEPQGIDVASFRPVLEQSAVSGKNA